MHDDDLMDQLLRDTMAARPPQLSPAFDAHVMRRVRPRRLCGPAAWLMRDLPVLAIVAAFMITVPIAVGVGAYGRRSRSATGRP